MPVTCEKHEPNAKLMARSQECLYCQIAALEHAYRTLKVRWSVLRYDVSASDKGWPLRLDTLDGLEAEYPVTEPVLQWGVSDDE